MVVTLQEGTASCSEKTQQQPEEGKGTGLALSASSMGAGITNRKGTWLHLSCSMLQQSQALLLLFDLGGPRPEVSECSSVWGHQTCLFVADGLAAQQLV